MFKKEDTKKVSASNKSKEKASTFPPSKDSRNERTQAVATAMKNYGKKKK